ncbi:hypothetical protein SEA_NIKE_100 [Microbacterium phage Nike]|nr:hypothetical protein SEA_NIKE_100 [Microbacterium phage Nike]
MAPIRATVSADSRSTTPTRANSVTGSPDMETCATDAAGICLTHGNDCDDTLLFLTDH